MSSKHLRSIPLTSAVPCVIASFVVVTAAFAGAPVTVTLEPSQDNTLYESDAAPGDQLSNGAGSFFFAGRTNSTALLRRGLLAFDIAAAVPAHAQIESVELTLNMSMSIAGPQSVSLHRALLEWGEGSSAAPGSEGGGAPAETGDASWFYNLFDTDLWATPGGDFIAAASATQSVDAAGFYTWASTPELVADVQSWLDDPAINYGWVVVGGEDGTGPTAKRFDSRENVDLTVRPQLSVTYSESVLGIPTLSIPSLVLLSLLLLAGGLWTTRRRRALAYRRRRDE